MIRGKTDRKEEKTVIKAASSKCRRIRRAVLLLLCLTFLLLPAAQALAVENSDWKPTVDPVDGSDDCSAVLYDNKNGLPTS